MSELRKKILTAVDLISEVVDVPEWDAKLEIRGMTGAERAKFMRRIYNQQKGEVIWEHLYPELLIATAYDPDSGEKVFEDADRDVLNTKAGRVLDRLGGVAQKLSGLGSEAEAIGFLPPILNSDST